MLVSNAHKRFEKTFKNGSVSRSSERTEAARRCEKRHFLRHLYIKRHHFTKTGSEQT
jgi:hypothetical protein